MMKINDIKIGVRLNIFLGATVLIIFTIVGIYLYHIQRDKVFSDIDTRMTEQVYDLSLMIQIQVNERQDYLKNSLKSAIEVFSNAGKVTLNKNIKVEFLAKNQETHETKRITIPSLYIGNTPLHNNGIVDKISKITNTKCTFFQKIDGGYMRIATNVVNKDGSKAIGTYIPDSSPVAQAISNGENYNARAFVVNDWLLTSYSPLLIGDEIVGIISIGFPEKDMANIKKIFSAKKYLQTGYPFLIDKNGKFIIHPTKEGEIHKDDDFFKQIIAANSIAGKTSYLWEGKIKFQYFHYIPEIESYASASIYEEELMGIINHIRNTIIIAVILSIAIITLIIILISRSISNAINKGVIFSQKISEGDLDYELEINQKDEIGKLSQALNNMKNKLKEVVVGINIGSKEIASASQQISSGAQQLSSGATEQASSAEEVSSAMEQMAANIQQNTDNAIQTEHIALQSSKNINDGSSAVISTVEAMKKIADKISVIGKIAEKTDLLAINAAIEAARAGDSGKGFSVVASEVRKLAESSQKSAMEIDELSKTSVVIADKSGELLQKIVPDIQKTAVLVQEIASASNEQNAGVNQVYAALNELNKVIQENAAASEELATSAEELTSMAEHLRNMVGYFKFNDNELTDKYSLLKFNKDFSAKFNPHYKDPNIKPYYENTESNKPTINLEPDDSEKKYERF